jgi:hypothetical protein
MTDLLKRLEDANLITIVIDPNNNQSLLMRIKPSEVYGQEISKFQQMLGLDQSQNDFSFDTNFLKSGNNELVVRTKSLIGVLFYFSHAVEVPMEDREEVSFKRRFQRMVLFLMGHKMLVEPD